MEQLPRKIIHVDMDSYFASVEMRDNPNLVGKPVAVGHAGDRGVVATANYEARKFGVKSAMSSKLALKACPELVFVPPRFDAYREVTRIIRSIFRDYTQLVEPLSLDEAYLDVTNANCGIPTATKIAKQIKEDILRETRLTASAGVSYNKFLSKIASDYRKPNGLYVITPEMGPAFVEGLKIGRFHGIGPATEKRMNEIGVYNGRDLKQKSLTELQHVFGKSGTYFYWIARGVDNREVEVDSPRKSIGAENTFEVDKTEFESLYEELEPLASKVWAHTKRLGVNGKSVTLKVKFSDFKQITRSRTLIKNVESEDELMETGTHLLKEILPARMGIRLIGITLSGFEHVLELSKSKDDAQMMLF
jgi:DNA polymerase-4